MKHKKIFILIFLLSLAAFFRFYRLYDIPFGLNNDAAWEGSAALDILRGNIKPYWPYAAQGWRGEGLFRLMVTFFTYFMGPQTLVIKLPSAILGLLTLIPFYLLLRLLFRQKIAFIATFLLATSGWHITMSKTGWRAIGVPLFSLLTFYFLFLAIKTKRKRYFGLTGIFLTGSLYTYDAARVLPLFFVFWTIWLILNKKISLKTQFLNLILMVLAFLITIFPLLSYATHHWSNFTGRANFLFIGHQIEQENSLMPLWNNLKTSVLLFNQRANGNDFFINEPLVDKPISWFLPLGFFISLIQIFKNRKQNYLFMVLLFLAFLIPGIFSVPNGNRGIGTLPTVYFFSAIGISFTADQFYRLTRKKIFAKAFTLLVLMTTFFLTYSDYLGPKRRELPGFYPETIVTLDYLKKIPNYQNYSLYFTNNYPPELLTFLLYQPGQKDPFQENYTWLESGYDFLRLVKKPNQSIGFIMLDNLQNQSLAQLLLNKYPRAKKINFPYKYENIQRPASIIILVN